MTVATFLICTVGGSPDPIVKSLIHWRPLKVYFVPTKQTRKSIEEEVVDENGRSLPSILRAADAAGLPLDSGRYKVFELGDGEDLVACLKDLRRLTGDVEDWVMRGKNHQVVVDFTGGTKAMSVAIGLLASRWPCTYSYVGGARRTKDGVGVVEPGYERIVHEVNPWDALGHRAVEDYVVLFNQHAYAAAKNVVETTLKRVSHSERKAELSALKQLAEALDKWDRFEHRSCRSLLEGVVKSANNLRGALGLERAERVLDGVGGLLGHLQRLEESTPPSIHHVHDLLANARRRRDEGRLDDAVARLYRAIEAIGQVALRDRHGVDSTEKVPLEMVPSELRRSWLTRASDGVVKVGLQDAFALLAVRGDPVGVRFRECGLSSIASPLAVRNRSILAHGFERVPSSVFDQLWKAALSLAEVEEVKLPAFPRIEAAGGAP